MEGILKIGQLSRCYLIFGEEMYLKQQALKTIQEKTVPESDLMNYTVFEGKEVTAEGVINASETLPFFSDYKLVVVKDGEFFKTGKKEETEKLSKWIKTLPEQTVLVFLEKEVDKRNGLYKSIKKDYEVVEANPLSYEALIAFVQETSQAREMNMSMKTIHYFVSNMPPSITHLLAELAKLETYTMGKTITQEHIEEVCVFALEQRVFSLVKEVANKEITKALGIYQRLIEAKESPVMILVLIARQYRLLLQVKYLDRSHTPPAQIAREVGIPTFAVKEHIQQAKSMTFKQIQTIMACCLESDEQIKTGKMEQVKCVELLIMQCVYLAEPKV